MHHPARSVPLLRSEATKTVLVRKFAKMFRLDQVDENLLRKLLGPIAKETALLRKAGL